MVSNPWGFCQPISERWCCQQLKDGHLSCWLSIWRRILSCSGNLCCRGLLLSGFLRWIREGNHRCRVFLLRWCLRGWATLPLCFCTLRIILKIILILHLTWFQECSWFCQTRPWRWSWRGCAPWILVLSPDAFFQSKGHFWMEQAVSRLSSARFLNTRRCQWSWSVDLAGIWSFDWSSRCSCRLLWSQVTLRAQWLREDKIAFDHSKKWTSPWLTLKTCYQLKIYRKFRLHPGETLLTPGWHCQQVFDMIPAPTDQSLL